jgi:hypothetical protein
MANLKYPSSKGTSLLSVAAIVLCATTAVAQSASDKCRPAPVIPLASEPPAKIVIDPPLAEPLASRGVVVIQYCSENLHIVPVFGPNALAVSPRVGHLHVTVDDASWRWADASGNPNHPDGSSPRSAARSTKAQSHLSFQKNLRPKRITDADSPAPPSLRMDSRTQT